MKLACKGVWGTQTGQDNKTTISALTSSYAKIQSVKYRESSGKLANEINDSIPY